jgi:GNAT superfamily N-acetyltransferase
MADVRIRDALASDVETITAFNTAMAHETEGKTLASDVLHAGICRVIDEAALGRYFVAEVEDRIVGQIMITTEWSDWRNGLWWWIQSVYVDPAARRQGIFRALYDHVANQARASEDVCGLRLYVEHANEQAKTTYVEMGMSPAGYELFEVGF